MEFSFTSCNEVAAKLQPSYIGTVELEKKSIKSPYCDCHHRPVVGQRLTSRRSAMITTDLSGLTRGKTAEGIEKRGEKEM